MVEPGLQGTDRIASDGGEQVITTSSKEENVKKLSIAASSKDTSTQANGTSKSNKSVSCSVSKSSPAGVRTFDY